MDIWTAGPLYMYSLPFETLLGEGCKTWMEVRYSCNFDDMKRIPKI